MLLRYLALASALWLGSSAASIEEVRSESFPPFIPELETSRSYELNLSCAECAFSYSGCSENNHPDSYLTIKLFTNKGLLLANGDIIFPTPVPMQFQAMRHWESGEETVRLMYSLDVLPLPRQPGGNFGELYRLKLELYDQQGRPATENIITVGLARDSDEGLQLFQVEENPIDPPQYRHHHHHNPDPNRLKESHDGWKSYLVAYLRGKPQHHRHCVSETTTKSTANGTDVQVVTSKCHGRHPHNRLDEWRDRSFLRLVRPVILPGLLGLVAGLVACVLGFLVGKILATLYVYCRTARQRLVPSSNDHDEEIALSDMTLSDTARSEKQRLIRVYGDPDSTHFLEE